MSDTKLIELQQFAKKALESESFSEGALHLLKALELCSVDASRIKSFDPKLQDRPERVNFANHVLQRVSDGVLLIDMEGEIGVANEAAHRILQRKGLRGRFWDQFADEEFGFSMREALRYGISHQLLYKTFAKIEKELEISTSFLYDGPKPEHGLLMIFRDISERQKLQRLVARSDRMRELGEMAAKVAHEIRNPLGGIRGFASLLYRDLYDQTHLQEMAGQIIEGTKALETLVTNVLVYARPVLIALQTLDLSQFLKQLGKFIKVDPAFPPYVKLALNIPNEPILASFDPEALKRALLNLLFNALQAMPDGGTLSLALMKQGESCLISVADTGVGMDEKQLEGLFSPLFTTKRSGNGLGLVETQKIIQAHGGKIEVRSIVGRGATFTLTLPLKR